ncbi:VTC domain-containing protein [Hyaloraphidium curvatum]|nr:VTC domain-containing protein [Hyaloraphidium curvatum]
MEGGNASPTPPEAASLPVPVPTLRFDLGLWKLSFLVAQYYYMDYLGLKRLLKSMTSSNEAPAGEATPGSAPAVKPITDEDEARFQTEMRRELEKVVAFHRLKTDELRRRIGDAEAEVEGILADPTSSEEERKRKTDAGACEIVGSQMDKISNEVNQMSRYNRLNYSGFQKMLKKHDKFTGRHFKPIFDLEIQKHPFYSFPFDPMIIKLSKLYDAARHGTKRNEELSTAGGKQQDFVRKTVKYWIHPDNVMEVKCIILKHLPVLVFAKGSQEPDPAISSVYFDNESFELYLGRLEKTEGAQAIRFRWYGRSEKASEVFIERKTHHEDWTGEPSVKQRVPIKETHMNDYIHGKYKYAEYTEKMRTKGTKDEKELQSNEAIANEVQAAVLGRKLRPMIRTFYNRTAFQLPGDARVRISLDTELTMIREDDFGRTRAGDSWRRQDVGTDFPFKYLPKEDYIIFPYAVLEVKLQTQFGQESPKWIRDLVASHLVEEVPKFSKFIHGVSTLLDGHVQLLPFWLPQMSKDIRKPAPPPDQLPATLRLDPILTNAAVMSPQLQPRREQTRRRPTSLSQWSEENGSERTPLLSPRGSGFSLRAEPQQNPLGTWFDACWPYSKLPEANMKVEPKSYFANERTFLSWLGFSVTLGGLSMGLLNFGSHTGQIAGLIFTGIALLTMVYALLIFITRAGRLRRKEPGPYDERVGPTMLVLVLTIAVAINVVLVYS